MPAIPDDERSAIVHLFRSSSIEMSVHDLPSCRSAGRCCRVACSFTSVTSPGRDGSKRSTSLRRFALTVRTVPHLPVRKLASKEELQQVLEGLSGVAR